MGWEKTRWRVLKRDGWACRYCGDYATHVDHVVPVSKGGTDWMGNLVAACAHCNISKGAGLYEYAFTHQKDYCDLQAARLERKRVLRDIHREARMFDLAEPGFEP